MKQFSEVDCWNDLGNGQCVVEVGDIAWAESQEFAVPGEDKGN